MKKKTIAVDIDDVLALGAYGFVKFSNETWGTNLTVEDYDERWAIMWQVDHEEEKKRAQEIYQSGIVEHFGHFEEAVDVLLYLKKRYKLVITTSRVHKVKDYTIRWIEKNFKDIFEEIHLAGLYDKLTPNSHRLTKADLVKSIGANYLIDDHPKHCNAAAGVGIKAFLFGDYRWNRDEKIASGVQRVKDWQEVLEYFENEG